MTTLRKAAQAALDALSVTDYQTVGEFFSICVDVRDNLRAALAEFDASLTDPAKISVHQTAEPAQPVAEFHAHPADWQYNITLLPGVPMLLDGTKLYLAPQPPAEFDASLTDPTKISVHQTAEPAQPVAWRSWTGQCGYGYWESQTDADMHSDPDYRPVPLYTAPPAPADVPVYPNCPHAHECVDGGRYGKGAYEDLMNNAMGGKPWGECLCGIGDDGKPKYQQPPADVPRLSDEEFLGAIARGWCHEANERKTMDPDLALAIAEEVRDLVEAEVRRRCGVVG